MSFIENELYNYHNGLIQTTIWISGKSLATLCIFKRL